MKFLRKFSKPSSLFIFSFVFLTALLVSITASQAAVIRTMTGAIDPDATTARFYDDPTSLINFKPTYVDPTGGSIATRINTSDLSGYAWGNKVGWISLNSQNCDPNGDGSLSDAVYDFCPAGSVTPFKVSKDEAGRLSGYAWGENTGWINFGEPAPATAFLSGTAPVTINSSTGAWSGYAWAENYGWMQFSCDVTNGCVKAAFSSAGTGGGGTPQIDGYCGPALNQRFTSVPTQADGLCLDRSITTDVIGDGSVESPWTWDCLGQNGGFKNHNNDGRSCTAYGPLPASCETDPNLPECLIAPSEGCVGDTLPCTNPVLPPPPPSGLCIPGVTCDVSEPVVPIIPIETTLDRPSLLCILGFTCDPSDPILQDIERPSLLCIFGFSCPTTGGTGEISPIFNVPSLDIPTALCVLGFGCSTEPTNPVAPVTSPISPEPSDLCVQGYDCLINN